MYIIYKFLSFIFMYMYAFLYLTISEYVIYDGNRNKQTHLTSHLTVEHLKNAINLVAYSEAPDLLQDIQYNKLNCAIRVN